MSQLKFSLFENSLDFLKRAMRYAQDDAERANWKYALLHLVSGLELLMKELLRREHWSLLFQNIDEASEEKLTKGNFKSVDAETAIKRLESIVGFALFDAEKPDLRRLRDLRNRVQHFDMDIKLQQLQAHVARGLAIYAAICQRYGNDLAELPHEIAHGILDFEKGVHERMKSIRPQLDASTRPTRRFGQCHKCWQDAVVFADDVCAQCVFCGHEFYELEDLVNACSEGPMGDCPECEDGMLGFVAYTNDDGEIFCARCDFTSDRSYWTHCTRCGHPYWQDDPEGVDICPDCWEQVTSGD